jgi:hypothetical protein
MTGSALPVTCGHLYTRLSELHFYSRSQSSNQTFFEDRARMNKFHVCCFLGALAAVGCGDDSSTSTGKGEVDVATLEDEGVMVAMAGDVASITVPFIDPVPMASGSAVENEMSDATSLVVSSVASGSSADISDGTMVDGEPTEPGEFSWELDEERSEMTLTFYNETTSGLTLESGSSYRATLAISENDFVVEVPAMTFDIEFE